MRTFGKILVFFLFFFFAIPLILVPLFGVFAIAIPNFHSSHVSPIGVGGVSSGYAVSLAPIIGIAVLMFFLLIFAGMLFLFKLLSKEKAGKQGVPSAEETRIMQQIYHGLSNLEKRVESLETILIGRSTPPSGFEKEKEYSDEKIIG